MYHQSTHRFQHPLTPSIGDGMPLKDAAKVLQYAAVAGFEVDGTKS